MITPLRHTKKKQRVPRGKHHNKTATKTTVSLYLSKKMVEKARNHSLNLSRITEQALSSILDYLEAQNRSESSKFLDETSFPKKVLWAGSSARIEHHPPKPSNNTDLNINWGEYKQYLLSKFSRSYALQVYNNGLRHFDCLENPQKISAIRVSIRGNALKAMVNLAKYLGCYEEYKINLRNHGVKWINTD
ncbi:hypothetical protein E2P47_01730, partial [Candidatus Bathyarchaeota archaeon]